MKFLNAFVLLMIYLQGAASHGNDGKKLERQDTSYASDSYGDQTSSRDSYGSSADSYGHTKDSYAKSDSYGSDKPADSYAASAKDDSNSGDNYGSSVDAYGSGTDNYGPNSAYSSKGPKNYGSFKVGGNVEADQNSDYKQPSPAPVPTPAPAPVVSVLPIPTSVVPVASPVPNPAPVSYPVPAPPPTEVPVQPPTPAYAPTPSPAYSTNVPTTTPIYEQESVSVTPVSANVQPVVKCNSPATQPTLQPGGFLEAADAPTPAQNVTNYNDTSPVANAASVTDLPVNATESPYGYNPNTTTLSPASASEYVAQKNQTGYLESSDDYGTSNAADASNETLQDANSSPYSPPQSTNYDNEAQSLVMSGDALGMKMNAHLLAAFSLLMIFF